MSDLLNQASLVMVPSGYKEDTVYSVVPTDGSGDLSFTRASNGTRVNSAGLVEVCPWNLLQYSEDFSNGVWTTYQSSITSNSTTAPNGTNTADSLIDNTSNDQHLIQQGVVTSAGTHTISVYAKSNTLSHAWIKYFDGTSAQESGIFNLTNATVSGSGSIESVGNGWCRLSLQVTTLANTGYFYILTSDGTNKFYAGTGKSIYIWGYQLNIGSTAKSYFPTTDRLNVPRLTYQNGGGGCPSLLLEKQSTNLALYSEQFDNAAWSKNTLTIGANATISPDGTQNADNLIPTTSNGFHYALQNISFSSGATTMSCYAKSGGYDWLVLDMGVSNGFAYFNVTSGVVGTTGSGATASIQSVGNGWYRCIVTFTLVSSGSYILVSVRDADNGGQFVGNGTSGVYLWGCQLEASSYPTSYIPTTSSSATRVADACFRTGVGSLFGTNKGTFFWQGVTPYFVSGAAQYLWDISDTINYNLNRFGLYMVATNTVQLYTSVTGGNNATLAQNSFAKIALVWNGTSCSLYINGAVAITQTISNSNPTAIHLNTRYSLNENGNTEVGEVVVFNTNLTNAELIALTTL